MAGEVNDGKHRPHTEEVKVGGADGEQDHRTASVVDREEGEEEEKETPAPLIRNLRRGSAWDADGRFVAQTDGESSQSRRPLKKQLLKAHFLWLGAVVDIESLSLSLEPHTFSTSDGAHGSTNPALASPTTPAAPPAGPAATPVIGARPSTAAPPRRAGAPDGTMGGCRKTGSSRSFSSP